jgi:hypothetical protein
MASGNETVHIPSVSGCEASQKVTEAFGSMTTLLPTEKPLSSQTIQQALLIQSG